VFDARDILSYVVGTITLPDSVNHPAFTIAVADVSGNKIVSSYDAALVFQYSVGMLSDFPVTRQASLFKWATAPNQTDVANLSITLQSSTEGMKFNVIGDNLNGFVAGELAIRYDAGVVDIDKGLVSAALRGATLQSKIDKSNRLIKIAMTTNDDITVSDPMVLASITVPPNSISNQSHAFTIEAAYLNEGKIQTNVKNGGIVGLGSVRKTENSAGKNPITLSNKMLRIAAGSNPVHVHIFSLNGRLVEVYKFGKNHAAMARIDLKNYKRGVYVYRVFLGNKERLSGTIMVGE
jgi:hypothetical protein